MASTPKVKWSIEEITLLERLVNTVGYNNLTPEAWNTIASHFALRNPKQCRERWMYHMRPDVTNSDWTEAEELELFRLQRVEGNRWKDISCKLPNPRSETSCKNRFYSAVRRIKRSFGISQQSAAIALLHASKGELGLSSIKKVNGGLDLDRLSAEGRAAVERLRQITGEDSARYFPSANGHPDTGRKRQRSKASSSSSSSSRQSRPPRSAAKTSRRNLRAAIDADDDFQAEDDLEDAVANEMSRFAAQRRQYADARHPSASSHPMPPYSRAGASMGDTAHRRTASIRNRIVSSGSSYGGPASAVGMHTWPLPADIQHPQQLYGYGGLIPGSAVPFAPQGAAGFLAGASIDPLGLAASAYAMPQGPAAAAAASGMPFPRHHNHPTLLSDPVSAAEAAAAAEAASNAFSAPAAAAAAMQASAPPLSTTANGLAAAEAGLPASRSAQSLAGASDAAAEPATASAADGPASSLMSGSTPGSSGNEAKGRRDGSRQDSASSQGPNGTGEAAVPRGSPSSSSSASGVSGGSLDAGGQAATPAPAASSSSSSSSSSAAAMQSMALALSASGHPRSDAAGNTSSHPSSGAASSSTAASRFALHDAAAPVHKVSGGGGGGSVGVGIAFSRASSGPSAPAFPVPATSSGAAAAAAPFMPSSLVDPSPGGLNAARALSTMAAAGFPAVSGPAFAPHGLQPREEVFEAAEDVADEDGIDALLADVGSAAAAAAQSFFAQTDDAAVAGITTGRGQRRAARQAALTVSHIAHDDDADSHLHSGASAGDEDHEDDNAAAAAILGDDDDDDDDDDGISLPPAKRSNRRGKRRGHSSDDDDDDDEEYVPPTVSDADTHAPSFFSRTEAMRAEAAAMADLYALARLHVLEGRRVLIERGLAAQVEAGLPEMLAAGAITPLDLVEGRVAAGLPPSNCTVSVPSSSSSSTSSQQVVQLDPQYDPRPLLVAPSASMYTPSAASMHRTFRSVAARHAASGDPLGVAAGGFANWAGPSSNPSSWRAAEATRIPGIPSGLFDPAVQDS